jgi:cell division septal protein FtsQ
MDPAISPRKTANKAMIRVPPACFTHILFLLLNVFIFYFMYLLLWDSQIAIISVFLLREILIKYNLSVSRSGN